MTIPFYVKETLEFKDSDFLFELIIGENDFLLQSLILNGFG